MKNITTTLTLIFSGLACLGQTKTDNYRLIINFQPSFISRSQLIINSDLDSSFIDLKILKKSTEDKVAIKPSDLDMLTEFLKNYKFQIKSNIDTVGRNKDGSVEISMGTDGIIVAGTFEENNERKKFQFWSPEKGTANERFMEVLFSILYKKFNYEASTNYFELLEQYFPHGLGLKKYQTLL